VNSLPAPVRTVRRKAVWRSKRAIALLATITLWALPAGTFAAQRRGSPNSFVHTYRLDAELAKRATRGSGTSPVIIELQRGAQVPPEFARYARRNGALKIIDGQTADVPDRLLTLLAAHPSIFRVHYDRPVAGENFRTSVTTGARAVQQTLGLTGAGVGVAVIDSGIATWHDDLTNRSRTFYPFGDQRVAAFVDFVNSRTTPYDDNGHGTHVAGIIAGNGQDSNGSKAGTAPDASLVSLKVLDATGAGSISGVIAALDWVLTNRTRYGIRVVNLSVSAHVTESYWTDPLTLAAKRLVDAGIVVVAAAGNNGRNANGQIQYGAIGAPGNAPWVLTVGASSTNGTTDRADDTIATFSSRGPTYIDWAAKPDLVAPGVGTVSLAAPESTFYSTKASALVAGSVSTSFLPYLSLSGTSMAAPVVSGTVALMLQANPTLTPNAVKAILEYTAQEYAGYNALTEGAGFLNAVGAVRLARFFTTAQPGQPLPTQSIWSKKIIWGNHRVGGGAINPLANAFRTETTWGVAKTDSGDNIVWGTSLDANIVWGTALDANIVWGTALGDNIVWGTFADDNIVWGTDCGGADCDNIVWGTASGDDNIVWGTASADDNIVWGTAGLDVDNIVWGTATLDVDNIVWGTATLDVDNIVWGTNSIDNIVWGTSTSDNIVWGTCDADNIVWGTNGTDNIVWGTAAGNGNIVWGTAGSLSPVWLEVPDGTHTLLDGAAVFDRFSDAILLHLIEYVPSPVGSSTTVGTTTISTTSTSAPSSTSTTTTNGSSTTTSPTTTTSSTSTTTITSSASTLTTTSKATKKTGWGK